MVKMMAKSKQSSLLKNLELKAYKICIKPDIITHKNTIIKGKFIILIDSELRLETISSIKFYLTHNGI